METHTVELVQKQMKTYKYQCTSKLVLLPVSKGKRLVHNDEGAKR